MNLIEYAIPFFIGGIVVEWTYGHLRGHNTYRLNDSTSSLFLGTLSQTRRFVTLGVGGYAYYLVTQYCSLPLMDPSDWLTWVLAFVLYDLCYYWLHRLGHERTILWAAHVAHHQSEDYNLTTALRQTSTGFLLSWLFYIPMYLLGIPAEVVVTVGALNLIYQFWVHSEHIPKLGWYEWFFVTASNHRVHHAQNDIYLDRNYGGVFIVWDRLFDSFQEELVEEPCVYGIRSPLRSWNPVKALSHVYLDIARDSWHTARWADKMKVWVAPTGWRPADVRERFPRVRNDLATFHKYDPAVARVTACYSAFQLVSVVLLLKYMQVTAIGHLAGVALWALMLATTVTVALWLEQREAGVVIRYELMRLSCLLALIGLGWQVGFEPAGLYAGALYLSCNLLLLPPMRRQAVAGNQASTAMA